MQQKTYSLAVCVKNLLSLCSGSSSSCDTTLKISQYGVLSLMWLHACSATINLSGRIASAVSVTRLAKKLLA